MSSGKTDLFHMFYTLCLLTTAFGAAKIAAEDGVVPTAQSTKFLSYTPESEGYSYQKSPYEDCCRRQQESQNRWSGEGSQGQSLQGLQDIQGLQGFQGQWQQQQQQPQQQLPPYQIQSNDYLSPMPAQFNPFGAALPPQVQYGSAGLGYSAYGGLSPSGIGAGASFSYGTGAALPPSEPYGASYVSPAQAQAQYYQSPVLSISSPEYYPSLLDNSLNFRKFHNKKFSKVQKEESNGAAGNFQLKHFSGVPYTRKTVFYGERVPIWKDTPILSDPTGDTSKVLEGK